jgi:hypothetical protein
VVWPEIDDGAAPARRTRDADARCARLLDPDDTRPRGPATRGSKCRERARRLLLLVDAVVLVRENGAAHSILLPVYPRALGRSS